MSANEKNIHQRKGTTQNDDCLKTRNDKDVRHVYLLLDIKEGRKV